MEDTTFPTATNTVVEPPHIATLDELMASHASTVNKENDDRAVVQLLKTPMPSDFRPELFQWAANGFPPIFVVKTFEVTPPSVCSDGVIRNLYDYVEYLLELTHGDIMSALTARVTNMTFSYSYVGNILRIHISKA